MGNTEARSVLAFLTDVTGMTFLVQINPFPHQGSAQVGVFGAESLPFLLSCGLNISSGPQIWCPKQITLCSKTGSPTTRLPFQKAQPLFSERNPHILSTLCMVGTLLMQFSLQACTFFIPSLISYVRTLGLGKLAHTAKCPGRGLSQVGQTPSSMLFPASQGQSSRFPSSLALALKDRKLSYVLEQKRNHAEGRVQ